MTDELEQLAGLFRVLAELDFRGASPLYERLAREAADDDEVLALLLPAAPRDRMPHLLFAAVQYLVWGDGADMLDTFGSRPYAEFRAWCLDRRSDLETLVATRVNQTNEVGRCAGLLPTLATVAAQTDAPLGILEVGASAGLNLLLDRYRYVFGRGREAGPADSDVVLEPRMEGSSTPPLDVPEVVWRVGLDRQPVDVGDDDRVRWLRACIWPEQPWRRDLFDAAVARARRDPPHLIEGDVYERLADIVGEARPDIALCIVHTAVLGYLPDPERFERLLRALAADRPLWWVSGEAAGLVPTLTLQTAPVVEGINFVFGVVPLGVPGLAPLALARAGSHGAWLEWLGPP
jgi:hypothetical protein